MESLQVASKVHCDHEPGTQSGAGSREAFWSAAAQRRFGLEHARQKRRSGGRTPKPSEFSVRFMERALGRSNAISSPTVYLDQTQYPMKIASPSLPRAIEDAAARGQGQNDVPAIAR